MSAISRSRNRPRPSGIETTANAGSSHLYSVDVSHIAVTQPAAPVRDRNHRQCRFLSLYSVEVGHIAVMQPVAPVRIETTADDGFPPGF
ncbi:hypothetical protein KCG44_14270 [Pacificimonas sp. WHA3]|uniref:Uncharacterized protein n=1 Tax=Pacificimonas pallii TaxID=2827236 RepID=A0ABS6SHP4_9SPHN|nr:hypothetical protein [Pacificimonas pallii]MBV7257948.1 hypothetical protein [Pacificimonas pallii]